MRRYIDYMYGRKGVFVILFVLYNINQSENTCLHFIKEKDDYSITDHKISQ